MPLVPAEETENQVRVHRSMRASMQGGDHRGTSAMFEDSQPYRVRTEEVCALLMDVMQSDAAAR